MKRIVVSVLLLSSVPAAGQTADLAVQRSAEPKALVAADAGAGAFAGEGMTALHVEPGTGRVLATSRKIAPKPG